MHTSQFSLPAVILHLLMATVVFFLFGMSWWMLALPFGPFRQFPFQLHKTSD